jgi:rod shape-determining protein MreD
VIKKLLAFPILALVVVLQTTIVSRLQLLSGSADLMLVVLASWALQEQVDTAWHWAILGGFMMAALSGLPFLATILGYLAVVGLARLVIKRVWELPIVAMFFVTFLGTLIFQLISYSALLISGEIIPANDVFSLIILPGVLLNLLIAIPINTVMRDLAFWMYPMKEEL